MNILNIFLPMGIFCFVAIHSRNIEAVDASLISIVVTGIWYFQKHDGPKQRGPVTIVYIHQGDRYKIAHMNFSKYKDEKTKKEV